jgi:uncharacterized protein (DUF1778 family)
MIDREARESRRLSLLVSQEDFRTLQRAATLAQIDLNSYIIQAAIEATASLFIEHDRLRLSERDSLRVLDLLENPPEPNERMIAAARALPRDSKRN